MYSKIVEYDYVGAAACDFIMFSEHNRDRVFYC